MHYAHASYIVGDTHRRGGGGVWLKRRAHGYRLRGEFREVGSSKPSQAHLPNQRCSPWQGLTREREGGRELAVQLAILRQRGAISCDAGP